MIYHFTDVKALQQILKDNMLEATSIMPSGLLYCAFTRNKELWFDNQVIRIAVSKQKLQTRFRIKPYVDLRDPDGHLLDEEAVIHSVGIKNFKDYIIKIDRRGE